MEMWHVGNQFQGVSEKWQGNRLGVRKRATVQWVTTKPGVWTWIVKETKKF